MIDASHDVADGDVPENEMAEGVGAVSPDSSGHTVPMKGPHTNDNYSTSNALDTNHQPPMSTNAAANWRQLSLANSASNSNDMNGYQQFHSPQQRPASPQAIAMAGMNGMALSHHKSLAAGM